MTDTDWTNDAPEDIGKAMADKHLRIIKKTAAAKRLKPPKNFRDTLPRCCHTCKCARVDEGERWAVFCIREPGKPLSFDTLEDLWTVVCDYYTLSPTGEHPLSGKFKEAPDDTD
jgi:hypothetical protein